MTSEYEAWHTFEHVPERVCVPGFLSGRRYGGDERATSRYFTLYDITTLDVLDTPEYRDLQDNPTPWSQKMRRSFRNFLRIPCQTLASAGEGIGGALGALVFTAECGREADALAALLHGLLEDHAITAYHLGRTPEIPAYPVFGTPAKRNSASDTWVLLVEGLLASDTDAALARITAALPGLLGPVTVQKSESARFLFKIEDKELQDSALRRVFAIPPLGLDTAKG